MNNPPTALVGLADAESEKAEYETASGTHLCVEVGMSATIENVTRTQTSRVCVGFMI